MLDTFIRAEHLDNSDHVFAKFLRDNGWKGGTWCQANSIRYIIPDDTIIAIAFYDNAKCRYAVWVRKGAKP